MGVLICRAAEEVIVVASELPILCQLRTVVKIQGRGVLLPHHFNRHFCS